MSTFIPMVSSSPPPLDETLDDDEFGGFAAAPPPLAAKPSDKFGDFAAFSEVIKDTVEDSSHFKPVSETEATDSPSHDWMDDDPEFADFTKAEPPPDDDDDTGDVAKPAAEDVQNGEHAEYKERTENSPVNQADLSDCDDQASGDISEEEPPTTNTPTEKPSNLELDRCCQVDTEGDAPQRLDTNAADGPLESPSSEECQDKPNQRPQKPDSQDTTSQGSMTDSGLCSDISPVPKFEDYPDFVEPKSSEAEGSDLQPGSGTKTSHERTCDSTTCTIKEESPGASETHSKDSDSGHGVEMNEQHTLPAESSSPIEDTEDNDISPNEETLVTGSVSDYQLQDSAMSENSDADDDDNIKPPEPEPLRFKTPSFSQDELEDMSEELDDSFGQFPAPVNAASESEEDAPRKETSDADSSQETSSNASEESKKNQKHDSEVQNKDAKKDEGAEEDDDDEFGDFDDFKSSAVSADAKVSGEKVQSDKDDDGDEWAAFGDDNTPTNDDKGEDGGWAAFQEPVHSLPPADDGDDDDDDEFGDFGDATVAVSAANSSVSATASSSPSLMCPEKKLERALCDCFPNKMSLESTSLAVDLLRESVSVQALRTQEVPDSPKKGHSGQDTKNKKSTVDISVWNNLKDLEKTCALEFHWNKSFNSQRLLKSLSIDTRNILMGHKRQSVPIFASQLGMLEPSRGPAKKEDEVMPLPTIVDTTPKPAPPAATTPIDIPPAEFDWSRSGLTNPLDVLQKEQEILQAIEPSPGEPPKMLEPLENLLANMKFTPTAPPTVGKNGEETELGAEAQDVIQVLRDFSFMQATVLMFPYKEFGD